MEKNPLAKYKEDNSLTIDGLCDILGFTKVTTGRLVNDSPVSLSRKKLETLLTVEEKTGVDMISYIKSNL